MVIYATTWVLETAVSLQCSHGSWLALDLWIGSHKPFAVLFHQHHRTTEGL